MRTLVVGQAPARGRTGRPAFEPDTPSGAKLAELFGVEDVSDIATAVNLVRRFPGSSRWNKGHSFPVAAARRAARRIKFESYDVVVLVGRRVAEAFGLEVDFLRWTKIRRTRVIVVPHPSGANHWWNLSRNRVRARRVLNRIGAQCQTKS